MCGQFRHGPAGKLLRAELEVCKIPSPARCVILGIHHKFANAQRADLRPQTEHTQKRESTAYKFSGKDRYFAFGGLAWSNAHARKPQRPCPAHPGRFDANGETCRLFEMFFGRGKKYPLAKQNKHCPGAANQNRRQQKAAARIPFPPPGPDILRSVFYFHRHRLTPCS